MNKQDIEKKFISLLNYLDKKGLPNDDLLNLIRSTYGKQYAEMLIKEVRKNGKK